MYRNGLYCTNSFSFIIERYDAQPFSTFSLLISILLFIIYNYVIPFYSKNPITQMGGGPILCGPTNEKYIFW